MLNAVVFFRVLPTLGGTFLVFDAGALDLGLIDKAWQICTFGTFQSLSYPSVPSYASSRAWSYKLHYVLT